MYGWGGDGCGKKGGEEAQAGHQNGLGSDEVDGLQRWGDVPPTAVEADQKYFVSEEAGFCGGGHLIGGLAARRSGCAPHHAPHATSGAERVRRPEKMPTIVEGRRCTGPDNEKKKRNPNSDLYLRVKVCHVNTGYLFSVVRSQSLGPAVPNLKFFQDFTLRPQTITRPA